MEQAVHVDQDVPAAHQVEPAERRVAGQVVPREDAHVANRLIDLIVSLVADEEPPKPGRRDVDLDVVEIDPRAGLRQRDLVQVGGQQLDRDVLGPAVRAG